MAEIEILNTGLAETEANIDQMVDIINSPEVKEADIIVLSKGVLNGNMDNIFIPNSTIPCDDPDTNVIFRNVSCAARKARKYVVMNMYTRVKCSEDNQPYCADPSSEMNIYNMMNVFDRNGAKVATYVILN